MARILYRIGAFAARRALVVVLAWVAILSVSIGAMLTLQKPLSAEFRLPGSEFAGVLKHLGEQIPAAAGGAGTVVYSTDDDQPFTDAQRRAIADVEARWRQLPFVTGTVDPFETQAQLDQGAAQIADAQAKFNVAEAQYTDGAHQLDQLSWLVTQGRSDIAELQANHPADPTLPARRTGQVQLEAQLTQGKAQLASARTQLDAHKKELQDGETLQRASSDVRFVSSAGNTALGQIRLTKQPNNIDPAELKQIPEVGAVLADSGVGVNYGQEITQITEPGGIGEIIGVLVAGVVLLVMLGSLVLAGLPLVVAITGVGVSVTLGLATTHWVSLHQMAPILGTMLGLAVGIDYALFIVNRYRRELMSLDPEPTRDQLRAAIAMAVGTAGSAVGFAGATVVIALAALLVSGIPVLAQMGLLAAFTVTVTVVVALTLVPALLSLLGRRALPRRRRAQGHRTVGARTDRWAAFVTNRATFVAPAVVVIIAVMALPALQLRLGLPDGGSEDPTSTAYAAFTMVEKDFGAGMNGPIVVVADTLTPVPDDATVATQAQIVRAITSQDGVQGVLPIGISPDRKTLAFQVVPAGGPSSEITVDVVDELRGPIAKALAADGLDIGVTGATVANIEVSQRLADSLPLYLLLVVGLSLLLLTIVFRSVVVPLVATGGFLLSVAGSFGAIVAVYQWGWLGSLFAVHRPGVVMSFMPTLLIGILFGLAMDYQMFLVSGMHEAFAHGATATDAVRRGYDAGARVVAAAALIMIAVFGGFVYAPMTMARPIGFGLAVGVLVDAFLIRLTLTPALMHLLGERAWWIPRWLDRLLPNLDVEGASIRTMNPSAVPADSSAEELIRA